MRFAIALEMQVGREVIPRFHSVSMGLWDFLFKIAIHVRKAIIVKKWGSNKLGGNNYPVSAYGFAIFLEN